MAWQPQPAPLGQLAQLLRNTISGFDRRAMKDAELMLAKAKESPDINNYLTYISITASNPTELSQTDWHSARSAGATMLKNDAKTSYKSIPNPSRTYIKNNILAGLRDPSSQIRNYIGNVITEVVRQERIIGWSEVLSQLVSIVANETSSDAQDGAMSALSKICEDSKRALDQEYQSQRPLASLLPKLLEFTTNQNAKIRTRALASINIFLTEPITHTARQHINDILPRIVQLTSDPSEEVRRNVCRSFALLADGMPQILVPHIRGIVEYTLTLQQQAQEQNPELALDAAEFFFEASSKPVLRDALGPYLEKVVPVLLVCTIYNEDDQLRFEGDEDDAEVEDEAKDIKPTFASSKASRSVIAATASGTTSGTATPQSTNGQERPAINGFAYEDEDDLDEGEIEEDDEDQDIDPEDEWNLRKCSAATLDGLALHYGAPVFNIALPWLMENLQHAGWPNREAAVLALGAIGPGCIEDIKPHLPQLVPYMITLLHDQQPVVRQISCWALSRFASWASTLDPAGKQTHFQPMIDGILQHMLDTNKKVQESAASAFATLEEASKAELVPYCNVIVRQFVNCFNRYKDRNIYILYDCVQTLAEYAGSALAQPELVGLLMPALMGRYEKVQDQSRELFPLFECLAFVAIALGPSFTPFAQTCFMRCIRVIDQNLEQNVGTATGYPIIDDMDKDFLVTSLDLMSSIIQALEEPYSTELAKTARPNMFELLGHCMKDDNNDVRQSAYALLGDTAIYIFPELQQYLPILLQILISQLDLSLVQKDSETAFRVINNACWSCGEIAMRQGPGMSSYVESLFAKLGMIMLNENVPESLNENAAIALGRLGIGCHQQLAPQLANFAVPFLKSMQKVDWTDEKGHAYKGFGHIVLDNPQALENVLLDFFMEMANAPDVFLTGMQDEGPLRVFERVLAAYKGLIGSNWDSFLHNLPPQQQQALRQHYVF